MTLCIVQARLGSHRLPKKSLMLLAGKPLIQHVMERAAQIKGVDALVLAVPFTDHLVFTFIGGTTVGHCTLMSFWNVLENDVLTRFMRVVERYPKCDTIMRISGDCPLLDPRIAEDVLRLYRDSPGCAYAWNVCEGYIDGTDVEVFSRDAVLYADRGTTAIEERQHVTPWIRRNRTVFTLPPATPSTLKTSVDTQEDFERVRALLEAHAESL